MKSETVPLRHGASNAPAMVCVREPCGSDEMAVDGVDTLSAVALLDRLLPSAGSLTARELVASDRDALLAALHRRVWGDRIVTTQTCVACGELFDLSFELSAIQRHLAAAASDWKPADDLSFNIPRLDEELVASALGYRLGATRLIELCGGTADSVDAIGAALEASAPIIDLELVALCAVCGHEQSAHFDLQSFVLQRLLNERDTLLAEVHLLASTYGWSLQEILSLTRSTRRHLAGTIDNLKSRIRTPQGHCR